MTSIYVHKPSDCPKAAYAYEIKDSEAESYRRAPECLTCGDVAAWEVRRVSSDPSKK